MPLFYHNSRFPRHVRFPCAGKKPLSPGRFHAGVRAASALLLLPLCVGAAAAPRRIVVPHGHGFVRVHGVLRGYKSRAVFALHARRGQHFSAFVVRGGPYVVMLRFPNGQHDGAPGGIRVVLPQTGDYQITVTEHAMGEPWRGPFVLQVTLR